MSGLFAARWEVTSYLFSHGSFVEAGKVRPLMALDAPGELWVERMLPSLSPAQRMRVGWVLCLVLTGRGPYDTGPADEGQPPPMSRDALEPLILGGRIRGLGLAETLKGAEAVMRRALAPRPGARFSSSAAFADALEELAPVSGEARPSAGAVQLAAPDWPVADEHLPAALEATLQRLDTPGDWLELAEQLDAVHGRHSARAALVRAHYTVDTPAASAEEKKAARGALEFALKSPGITPELESERLGLGWRLGYVRMLAARPAGELPPDSEAHVAALMGLLQHPSLRFIQLLSLNGTLAHAHRWVQALQRQPPPALRRVHITGVPATDPYAIDVAYRFPRWTWTWGKASRGSLWARLFSPGSG